MGVIKRTKSKVRDQAGGLGLSVGGDSALISGGIGIAR